MNESVPHELIGAIANDIHSALATRLRDESDQISSAFTALLLVQADLLHQIKSAQGSKQAIKMREILSQRIHALNLDDTND